MWNAPHLDAQTPAWADPLPSRSTLDYVRALGGAVLVVAVAVWMLGILWRDPRGIVRVARRKVGA